MRRYNSVFILAVLILVLLLLISVKYSILTKPVIVANKDFIGVLKDLLTILAIIVGALLSYFRFFSGRLFSEKADIDIKCSVIETPQKTLFHILTVSMTNKSNITIWHPEAKLVIRKFSPDKNQNEELVDDFYESDHFKNDKMDAIIDSGETASYVIWREFETKVWAVAYSVEITSDSGRKWQKDFTVANAASK
jgi:hypothetical protein